MFIFIFSICCGRAAPHTVSVSVGPSGKHKNKLLIIPHEKYLNACRFYYYYKYYNEWWLNLVISTKIACCSYFIFCIYRYEVPYWLATDQMLIKYVIVLIYSR